jgi:short-subunit dehydrogenase
MNKTVLITGATGGLAQALVKNLIIDNYQLVLVSRNSKIESN